MNRDGYYLNVARLETKGDRVSRYYHYCNIGLGTGLLDFIMPIAKDIIKRFPAPEFNCTLTKWENRGQPVHIE
jgi:hypothetical protein